MPPRPALVYEKIRTGLWPVPAGMLILAVLLFAAATAIDRALPGNASLQVRLLYSGSGDDARNLLSTLVAAIITMSSVVFSITIVALSLAANQFGSRLIRTYVTDTTTKSALGLFMMTVAYCLMGLRSVEKDMAPAQVPHVTVTLGLILSLACVLALLFFVHRVARSIIADEVIRRAAAELERTIAALPVWSEDRHDAPDVQQCSQAFESNAAVLRSQEEGYVQAVEHGRLVALAERCDLLIRLDFRPGDYMCKEGFLCTVAPRDALTEDGARAIQAAVVIGPQRTPTQDVEFSMRHLVDIALRALSPGINDANTALVVIDHLCAALSRLMCKRLPRRAHRDGQGRVRLLAKSNSYDGVVSAALNQIRQSAATQPSVIINLLSALARVGEHVRSPNQADVLRRHAGLLCAAGLRETEDPSDRADIEAAHTTTLQYIDRVLSLPHPVFRIDPSAGLQRTN
ncbi:DUF2254 domain-containing protein [Schlegelella sp. S2-27]|uniref:DUF2254 domain-containing protein n=1 Tax=Caldimonas mangrovi TaxID=2944811 RepID=A0ABT0YUF8_9BURK|nr:DUF2254 domain-containing protein [Caldimonas mangrovi]MCM5681917.1 DUF2254 domain-containing protein [Caldimonas mangrovi]